MSCFVMLFAHFCLSWLMSTDSVFVFNGLTPEGIGAKCHTPWKFDLFHTDSFVLAATDWTGGQPRTQSLRIGGDGVGAQARPIVSPGAACGDSTTSGEQLALSQPGNGRAGPVEILTDRCSHCKWCVKPEWPSADPRQKPLSGRTPTQSRAKATFPVSPTFASDG